MVANSDVTSQLHPGAPEIDFVDRGASGVLVLAGNVWAGVDGVG